MNCERVTDRLLAFFDGRLDATEQAEIDAHLVTCARCRARAGEQREVAALLGALQPPVVSPSFGARLSAALDEASGWYGVADWRWLSARVVPVAAGLLVAAAVAVARTPSTPSTAQAPVSLTQVVESWASGGAERTPAAAVLWKDDVSQESAVLTVLAATPDTTLTGQPDER